MASPSYTTFGCLILFVHYVVSPDMAISAEQKPILRPDKHYNKKYNFPSDVFTKFQLD
jgi:hypothetical protein